MLCHIEPVNFFDAKIAVTKIQSSFVELNLYNFPFKYSKKYLFQDFWY